jgi:hypothetical protein
MWLSTAKSAADSYLRLLHKPSKRILLRDEIDFFDLKGRYGCRDSADVAASR